ncbi:hypothetical protein Tco_1214536 [Tanacetum coccineum]
MIQFNIAWIQCECDGILWDSLMLKARDCKELVEKVQNRVLDWKNKSLSIAASAFHSGIHLAKDRAGLTLYSHVGDVIRDGDWVWPRVLLDKYQFLNECTVLFRIIVGYAGMALNDGYGKEYFHCSELGWYSPGADKVPWVDLIWFAMGILGMLSHLVNYPTHKLQTTQEPSGSFSMMGLFECVGNLHDLFVKLLRIQHDIFSFICPFC